MADVKISNLPEVTTLNTADVAPFVSSGVTSKITLQNIAANMPQVSSSISASNALTASYIDAANVVGLNLSQIASGSATASITPGLFNVNTNTNVQGNLTASNALFTGAITAQTLVVQTVSSSIIYSSGSNTFGDELTDIQQFTGSVRITGSLTVDGPLNATSSWAINAVSSSYPISVSGSTIYSVGPFSPNNFSVANSIYLGYLAGDEAPITYESAFLGLYAGYEATRAYQSNFIGRGSGYQAAYANASNFLGIFAGNSAYSSSYSNFIGSSAGENSTHAYNSNFLGYLAGSQANFANSSNFLGYYAGHRSVSASYSIFLGHNAGRTPIASATMGTNNIIIGTNITLEKDRSDAVNIGAIIFATGSYSNVLSNAFFSGSVGNGRVGINVVKPVYNLDVSGSGNYTNGLIVTGSLMAPIMTGSLFGTSSWAISASNALTASFALNAAGLSTTQIATGSVTASVNINSASFQVVSGSTNLLFVNNSGLITAQRLFLSSSRNMASGSTLIVFGSGSAQPVFTVQGSQGELFSVNDSLSGSLFSVNDISGLPIIEAFSDNRVLIGSYQAPMLTTTVRTTLAAGNNIIYQNIPTASYDAVFFEYSLRSGSNARAGSIMGIWSGSDANYTEVVTADFGNTTGVKFMVMVTGSNVALTGSATTTNWTMKTIVRSI